MLVRLEMDEERMSLLSFNTLPGWAALLGVASHLAAGIALGMLYFRVLWSSIRRLTEDGRVTTTIALMVGRFVLLASLLALASLEGALPLLMMALGVFIGRSIVMRHTRKAAP
jgi:N-ATPase, AtpR subunit